MNLFGKDLIEFKYNGLPFQSLNQISTIQQAPHGEVHKIRLSDGSTVTTVLKYHEAFRAFEWQSTLENDSDLKSGLISELWDCAVELPLPHDDDRRVNAYLPVEDDCAMIFSPSGSNWSDREFFDEPSLSDGNHALGMLFPGWKKRFTASGGRSSEKKAPFFNIRKGNIGYVVAIGWSGQWVFECERKNDSIIIKCGIEDVSFRLDPGERLSTSSIVIMPYEGTFIDGQNKFRRLVKKHFSLIGRPGRLKNGPFCAGIWGGMPTDIILERLDVLDRQALPFEYIWIDAGWYGNGTKPSPDEFEGDWGQHTGDWRVNPFYHPDGLKSVSKKIHESGRGFLLWFEPERVVEGTPIAREHPEYFLRDENSPNLLLDLGNNDAWDYCFNTLSNLIEELGIDFYRHDFNMSPLSYWSDNDAPDRQGISQIKHINGLYRLWDALLERFPHLMIDNCASGGRRIDIETLRRSVPLWRSDAMCPADFKPETAQCHALTFPLWLPYSGTGAGRQYDTYRVRSCYSSCLTVNYAYSQRDQFGSSQEELDWISRMCSEYLRVRPYLEADFYPLTSLSIYDDAWTVLQYDCPERKEGIILAFRRSESCFDRGSFTLNGAPGVNGFAIEDADSHGLTIINGREISIELPDKRSSKLLFYKYKS